MGKVLFCSIVMSFSFIAYAKQDINSYFYDIVFLNGLTLASEALDQCHEELPAPDSSYAYACDLFEKIEGKKIQILFSENEKKPTIKTEEIVYPNDIDEDFSLHYVDVYTKKGNHFKALIDTASFASFADIETNLSGKNIKLGDALSVSYKHIFHINSPYRKQIAVGVALVDLQTNIAGMRNKILLTHAGVDSVLGVDFIGQYDQFSFYPNGITIQPRDLSCSDKCMSYDADFDGENLHFFYPLNGRIERVSFETGSPISTVPFSLEDRCIAEEIDFFELEERGLDVGDEAKICKKEFEFGDYTMQSSVVTQTSREIDGEPLPVMGMNMINAFDHITVDMPAGKIYFYTPE